MTTDQFWKNKNLTEQEKNELLKETCRKVFSTEDGKVVLNMLMSDLHYFNYINNTGEESLNNYAKFLIRERLGVRDTKSITDFIIAEAAVGGGR